MVKPHKEITASICLQIGLKKIDDDHFVSQANKRIATTEKNVEEEEDFGTSVGVANVKRLTRWIRVNHFDDLSRCL